MPQKRVEAAGEKRGLAVGGLGLTYQATLIDGKTLAFEVAVDATMAREDLDEALDVWIGAAKRQQALEELPLVKAGLHANIATLRDQERAKAQLVASVKARDEIANRNRRNPRPASDGDRAAVTQFDQRIQQVKAAIATARARIPYLEAIIARKEPPELFPQAEREEEAAEAA